VFVTNQNKSDFYINNLNINYGQWDDGEGKEKERSRKETYLV
jgi:hypothetical protein